MKITPKNIYVHELIGLHASVVESNNATLNGLSGKVVFESKNMLYIAVNGNYKRVKMVPKRSVTLSFILPDGSTCIVKGNDLIGRPEDRIERVSKYEC
jgi:RNase P/RNase MRP subunit p29